MSWRESFGSRRAMDRRVLELKAEGAIRIRKGTVKPAYLTMHYDKLMRNSARLWVLDYARPKTAYQLEREERARAKAVAKTKTEARVEIREYLRKEGQ